MQLSLVIQGKHDFCSKPISNKNQTNCDLSYAYLRLFNYTGSGKIRFPLLAFNLTEVKTKPPLIQKGCVYVLPVWLLSRYEFIPIRCYGSMLVYTGY